MNLEGERSWAAPAVGLHPAPALATSELLCICAELPPENPGVQGGCVRLWERAGHSSCWGWASGGTMRFGVRLQPAKLKNSPQVF